MHLAIEELGNRVKMAQGKFELLRLREDITTFMNSPPFQQLSQNDKNRVEDLLVEVLAKEDPQLYEKFSADLKAIKSDYKQLKQQLPESANQAMVVKAMERNLELQLQVVSQQLTIINQVTQFKKDNQL